jgi:hypothetical protein
VGQVVGHNQVGVDGAVAARTACDGRDRRPHAV